MMAISGNKLNKQILLRTYLTDFRHLQKENIYLILMFMFLILLTIRV